jgi:antitoxin (DNA-binding transcriptional repressor) of toxin-antitoxin stability system
VIAKAGKPMVKVTALDAPESAQMRRFGFMAGQIKIPADFNTMGAPDNSLYFSAASASHPTLAVKASKLEARDQRD